MSDSVSVGEDVMSAKQIKNLWIFLTFVEVIVAIIGTITLLVIFVPKARLELMKTPVGQFLMGLYGREDYDKTVLDLDFDKSKIKSNEDLPEYVYSSEYTNLVMFGIDSRTSDFDSATNSDSIIIVSIHNTTNEVRMVSIYRDTYLEIEQNDGTSFYSKVNAAYSVGGPTAALNTINTNMDLDIHDYIVVNFAGVAKIIDALGGIEVNLTKEEKQQLNYHLSSTELSIGERTSYVKKYGENIHLNGIQATTYCRIRKTAFYDPQTGAVINNDFGRAARQRSVIMKLVDKAKEAGISELKEACQLVFDTNTDSQKIIGTSFTWDELMNMMPILFDFELAGTQSFPNSFTTGSLNAIDYVFIKGLSYNVSKLHEFLYGVEDYEPSYTVQNIDYTLQSYTGIYPDYTQTPQYSSTAENETRLPSDLSGGSIVIDESNTETTKKVIDSKYYGYDDEKDDSGI